MPLTFPNSPSTGTQYIDDNNAVWEFDGVKWNVVLGTYKKMFSGVKVILTSSYSLTSNSSAVNFDTENFDTESYYTVSEPSKITVNKNGFYRINFSAYTGLYGSSHTLHIKKNGYTTLSSVAISPNQYTNYDEIVELISGDFIEIYASESSSTGTLVNGTFLEVVRLGLSVGSSISPSQYFSGVRGKLTSTFSTTTSVTAVSWSTTDFNQNSDVYGSSYWTNSDPTKFTIKTTGYYRLKGVITVNPSDSYNVSLNKNTTTSLATINIGPNGFAQIDDTYRFVANDYIQLFVNDLTSSGSITSNSYIEITRLGV
jgi:hypothetical protein